MRFMSIYKPRKKSPSAPSAEHMAEMGKLIGEMSKSGALVSTGALSSNRATVRMEGGNISVIDGPFSETKEMIAGYAVLNHASKAEAVAGIERFLRIAGEGESELREVYDLSDFEQGAEEKPDGWRDREKALRDEAEANPASPMLPPTPPGKERYMVLLKADENTEAGMMPNETLLTEMGALMDEMVTSGKMLYGDGLKPSAKGTRVRLAEGVISVTDGPFAESKELVAGYSAIEVDSKSEAVDFARRMLDIHARGTGIDAGEIELFQMF